MNQKLLRRWAAVTLLGFAIAGPVVAQSWWDEARAVTQSVAEQMNGWSSDSANNTIARGKGLPLEIPEGYHYSILVEPVFNSEILVLQAGRANAKTLVLVHGLGQVGHQDWRNQIAVLAQYYHVLSFDLPGFGYSGVPSGRYSPTHYAAVVKAVVDHYAKSTPIVVGHSMGGAVSLRYAAQYPDQTDRLVLVDAAGILERTAFVKHIGTAVIDDEVTPKGLRATLARVKDFGTSLVELGTFNDPTGRLQESDLAWRMLLSNAPNTNAGLSLVNENFARAVFEVAAPTTIIWGRQDNVAPLRTGKMLAAQMQRAKLYVIDGAAHVPMVSHAERFNELLLQELLQKLLPQPLLKDQPPSQNLELVTDTIQPSVSDSLQDLYCKGKSSQRYTGNYRNILIENCSNIELLDIDAASIHITNSLVHAENLTITATGTALALQESVLVITNGIISGAIGIELDGSRLDVAGLKLQVDEVGVVATTKSRLVASVCQLVSPTYSGVVHGSFNLVQQPLQL